MARILVGSWMVRYPLGGNLSWTLQWLVGFHRLGHEVYLVEKADCPDSCFDPARGVMSDDGAYGVKVVADLLSRFGLERRLCFVDGEGCYHGIPRQEIESLFRSADLFADIGTHGAWMEEAEQTAVRILVDGEPGYTQMKMETARAVGKTTPAYDYYFSNGANIGTTTTSAPTVGKAWRPLFNPVVPEPLCMRRRGDRRAPSHGDELASPRTAEVPRVVYGQKDVEFEKFVASLKVQAAFEVAVAGRVPTERLKRRLALRHAHEVTASFDSRDYIRRSRRILGVQERVRRHGPADGSATAARRIWRAADPSSQDTGFSNHSHADADCSPSEQSTRRRSGHQLKSTRRTHGAREIAAEYLDARRECYDGLLKRGYPRRATPPSGWE